MLDNSTSSSEFVDINTNPLMEAAFAAETHEEMILLRHLVCSIQERSPYARKYAHSGEAVADLDTRAFNALQEVLRDANHYEADRRACKRLKFESRKEDKGKGKGKMKSQPPKKRPLRRRGGGVKIRELEEDNADEEDKRRRTRRGGQGGQGICCSQTNSIEFLRDEATQPSSMCSSST